MSNPVSAQLYNANGGTVPSGAFAAVPYVTTAAPATTSVNGPYGPWRIGQLWVNSSANTTYILTSISATGGSLSATWTSSGAAAGALNTLTADSGGALTPTAGNINILGTANQITTTGAVSTITLSLPSVLIAPGSLEVTSGFTVDAGAVTIATGTSAINISADAAATTVNIATGAGAKLLTLGSTNGASALTLHLGSGNFVLDGVAASTYAIGASTTTGTITIGGTAQTGTLTLGSSSGTNTLIIAGGAGATTVQIANAQVAGSVSIGAAMTTGTIALGGAQTSGTISIGGGVQTGTITVGGGTGAQTVNLATGGTGVKTVHIADAAVANVVTLGSTTGAASTTIQAGSGGINLTGDVNLTAVATKISLNGGAVTDFIGQATLTNGTVTVANTNIAAADRILVTRSAKNGSTAYGSFQVVITAATNFVITSCKSDTTTETGDASTVDYIIFRQT